MKYFKNTKRQQENGSNGHAENYLQTTEINWDKGGIGQKWFPENSDDLRNAIDPYS